ncbi:MAG: prepilin-type N-terminal cleavage/methylation domain-containing protein [Cyanobacteria bacterium NC_groundwater_1444_Ag_S-0.65um_54_12]|nr:prepilin-type N-terminal cleavage/methylation domain-containing protein [Cyanobacteria bacterium NC_groundwater_1444_Ag_S-0.65um_54_12]
MKANTSKQAGFTLIELLSALGFLVAAFGASAFFAH